MQLRSGKPILRSEKSPSPKRLAFSEPLVESVHEYSYDMPTWTWLEKAIKQKDAAGIMRLLNDAQKKVADAEKKAEDAERRIHEMRLELQTIKCQQAHGLDINPSSSKVAATASPVVEDPPSDDEDAEGLHCSPVVEYPASDDDEAEAWQEMVTIEVGTKTGRKRTVPDTATNGGVGKPNKKRRQELRKNLRRA